MKLASRISVLAVLYVSLVGAVFAAPAFQAGPPGAGHTKAAECKRSGGSVCPVVHPWPLQIERTLSLSQSGSCIDKVGYSLVTLFLCSDAQQVPFGLPLAAVPKAAGTACDISRVVEYTISHPLGTKPTPVGISGPGASPI